MAPFNDPAWKALVTTVYGTEKRPMNKMQWEAVAQQNTQKLQDQGSLSPLVWVRITKHQELCYSPNFEGAC